MASTGICAYCGAPISSSSRKCPQCGADNPLYVVPVRGTASDGGAEQPASTGTCPYCGGTLRSDQKFCTNCGAENPHFVKDTPRRIQHPRTIGELKEYCAERGMPLLRMRFFIGEDRQEPRAFGIYQNGDRFVVYKNKDNGNRAVRYDGPDEAYAVNEIFQKLLTECHNRGIYPDGRPAFTPNRPAADRSTLGRSSSGRYSRGSLSLWQKILKGFITFLFWPMALMSRIVSNSRGKKWGCLASFLIIIGALFSFSLTIVHWTLLIGVPAAFVEQRNVHKDDGYYRYEDQTVYYKDGRSYYYDDAAEDWWIPVLSLPGWGREEAYLGEEYAESFGFKPFRADRAGYPSSGYYRLSDGWYYHYSNDWFRYDEASSWQREYELPQCPPGFSREDSYLGWSHDPGWDVPDVDEDFYIATLKDYHSRDGYYRFADVLYYYFGESYDRDENWYTYGENGWQHADAPRGDRNQAYLGPENDPAWGVPDAADSFVIATQSDRHSRDGYYRFGEDLFYYYGKYYDPADNWYSFDGTDWSEADAPQGSYDTTYQGEDWDSGWGSESFTDSNVWDDLHPSYSGSSSGSSGSSWDSGSYDSWDSGDTDWGSDW